jgi:hypothetical protein
MNSSAAAGSRGHHTRTAETVVDSARPSASTVILGAPSADIISILYFRLRSRDRSHRARPGGPEL